MICKVIEQPTFPANHSLNESVVTFIQSADLPPEVENAYYHFLSNDGTKIATALTTYFNSKSEYSFITPLIIYNENNNQVVTILANSTNEPPEPGEPGSILSYVRSIGFDETFLCSDCYGQLSCSSCAIEVISGKLKNTMPRDEEFDMLDIDESKPPTEKTRLSCQACIGTDPLIIKIRKSVLATA
tara:strand:+ start:2241 stop:2798 length:558 start_codon:yes stop_codon:yes gene_type:complete